MTSALEFEADDAALLASKGSVYGEALTILMRNGKASGANDSATSNATVRMSVRFMELEHRPCCLYRMFCREIFSRFENLDSRHIGD